MTSYKMTFNEPIDDDLTDDYVIFRTFTAHDSSTCEEDHRIAEGDLAVFADDSSAPTVIYCLQHFLAPSDHVTITPLG